MTDPAILEAAARALRETDRHDTAHLQEYFAAAQAVLTAVTPLIRAAALEEAAVVADGWTGPAAKAIATDIRALKPTSPSPSADSA